MASPQHQRGTGPQRHSGHHPDHQQSGPAEHEEDSVGQHHGDQGADTGLLVIAAGKDDDGGKLAHQGSDQVGAGVTDTIGALSQLRREAQQHEHGHEHGGQEGPLGGRGAHEQVGKGGEQHEQEHQGDGADAGALKELGAFQGDDGAYLGVLEVVDELRGDKDQRNVAAHGSHGIAHGAAHIPVAGEGAGLLAVKHSGYQEENHDQGDDAVHEGGLLHQAAGLGVSQEGVAGDEDGNDANDHDQEHHVGQLQGLGLGGVEGVIAKVHDVGGLFICAQSGLHDPVGHQGADDGDDDGGGAHEEPVAGGQHLVGRVDDLDCLIGDTCQHGV